MSEATGIVYQGVISLVDSCERDGEYVGEPRKGWLSDIIIGEMEKNSDYTNQIILPFVRQVWRAMRDVQARVMCYIPSAEADVTVILTRQAIKVRATSINIPEQYEIFSRIAMENGTVVRYESLSTAVDMLKVADINALQPPIIDERSVQAILDDTWPEAIFTEGINLV